MKSTFEELGGTYHQEGDYLLPDLAPPETPHIGMWGQRRRQFLKEHKEALYAGMLLSGELNQHLEEIDREATRMFAQLVKQMKETEGVQELTKNADQMEWVRQMNSIGNRAMETVNRELIYL